MSDVIERKMNKVLPIHIRGFADPAVLHFHLTQNVGAPPWEKDNKVTKKSSTTTMKTVFYRVKKTSVSETLDGDLHKYLEFDQIIAASPYKKIEFRDVVHISLDSTPNWVLIRLEKASRAFRFELPYIKKLLEPMTPLQYLATYTRLQSEQLRRYQEIFKKSKAKYLDYIEFKTLHSSLNSMFGGLLSDANFNILKVCLFISEDSLMDLSTFVGLCAFTDRLFWTCYLGSEYNTFLTWSPNRSALECVDFEYLDRKLKDVKLSKELYVLLHSLA
ncbi:uncharacterized protein LOC106053458 isoform X2 [Biomphalaria glabrata]|uniref:Uncharacterized protein LOC106053458 isoform X2 n=1 Tax=Biomphalaria glabrata TaxID=6526 RepID=A0A9W2YIU5_BIOGL|nr:uncharacterized protein LOC106053458 isoform X2 [Biomphalaria glabrata]